MSSSDNEGPAKVRNSLARKPGGKSISCILNKMTV
ncbi:hypothetical protein BVRB_3g063630 [Beta vulgaris subsp. vulgaris]|nr:hypothetical protein BVRB_3g063630 [Beta vulgaris subsp. vulgaris]